MYGEVDGASDIEEEFYSALALLHSNEENSTAKLRQMLDAAIEKKQSSSRIVQANLPKKYLRNTKSQEKLLIPESLRKRNNSTVQKMGNDSKFCKLENCPVLEYNHLADNLKAVKTINIEYDDCTEKGDIPRISIPDEGSTDELLCKICNGAKLGPLILLECQDCQDVYHPLCHQPPVVDVDVYDPRIVWRCSKCIESSNLASTVNTAIKQKHSSKFYKADKVLVLDEFPIKGDGTGNTNLNDRKNEVKVVSSGWMDFLQSSDTDLDVILLEDSVDMIKESPKIPNQALKKRIGSNFLVSRTISKQ